MSTEISTPMPPKNRLDFIEALRGLAALYVITYHVALIPNPPLSVPLWASKFILSGGTGVTLFFIVSAFTLTLSMRQHEHESHPTRRFYIRRIFRIVPLFYFWMIISWLRDKFWFGTAHSSRIILLNMFFGFNLIPGRQEGFVWASWTLGVEMLFYFIFPLIYHFVTDKWKALGFFLVTLTISSIYQSLVKGYLHLDEPMLSSFIQFSFLIHLPTFAFGIFVYYVYEQFILERSRPASWAFCLITASAFGYMALLDDRLQFLIAGLYWQAVIYGTLLLGLAIIPVGLFVNRVSRFYGRISYSLYLNHPTLVFSMMPIYRAIYNWPTSNTIKYGACFFLTLGLLTALSYVTYHIIEHPGMRLGNRLIKKLPKIEGGVKKDMLDLVETGAEKKDDQLELNQS